MNETDPFPSFPHLDRFPYFLAQLFQQLHQRKDPQSSLDTAANLFELSVYLLVLILVSEYLYYDREQLQDWGLDKMLAEDLFTRATFKHWQDILLIIMDIYRDQRQRLFVPEIHKLFWEEHDDVTLPNYETRTLFENLRTLRNEIRSGTTKKTADDIRVMQQHATKLTTEWLLQLQFLKDYDIIHVLWIRDGKYRYERYSGLTIRRETRKLPVDQELLPMYPYLRKRAQRTFLNLYPLALASLMEEVTATASSGSKEIGLYKAYRPNRTVYLLPVQNRDSHVDDTAEDIERLIQSIQVVDTTGPPPPLNWRLLCQNLRKISEQEMNEPQDSQEKSWEKGEMQGKYDAELYLQRSETYAAYEAFMDSAKRVLIITGKSGVGKSSFLLSLKEQLSHTDTGPTGIVIYNGSNLHTKETLQVRIAQDLGRVLDTKPYTNLWQSIAALPDLGNRKLILAVDAINEHPEPVVIMKQINELAKENHSWLKIIVTSRPQAWRNIQRNLSGLLNDDLFYRQPGTYRFSVQLKSFARNEVPIVYEKYRERFRLDKTYDALSPRMQQIMRDPLMLRLLAQTFREKILPPDIRLSDIYQSYLDSLIETNRLARNDLDFLRNTLVPLLWEEDNIANAISAKTIEEEKVGAYSELYDLIFDTGIGVSGKRVNQSFQNLVDTEILVKRGSGHNYRIEFAYERFFEYFVGEQIEAGLRSPSANTYIKLIDQVTNSPYLWGAIRTAILMAKDPIQILLSLAENRDPIVRNMVIDSFIELGKETVRTSIEQESGYKQVRSAIHKLMESRVLLGGDGFARRQLGRLVRAAHRLLGWRYVDVVQAIHLKDIALEVAYGMTQSLSARQEIIEFHLDAFSEPLWQTRRKAARNLYGIWYTYPDDRKEILRQIDERVNLVQIIRGNYFVQSTIGFLLRVLFTQHDDETTISQILIFAQNLLDRIPQVVVEAGSAFTLSLITTLIPGSVLDSIDQILRDETTREEFVTLVRYLDPALHLSEAEYTLIRRYLDEPPQSIDESMQFLRQYFAKNVLLVQATRHFPEIKLFIEQYFVETSYVSTRGWLLSALTFTHPSTHPYAPPNEMYTTVDRITRTYLAEHPGVWSLRDNPFIFVSRLWCSQNDDAIPVISDEIHNAYADKDWPYLNRIIIDVAYIGHLYPLQALKTLEAIPDWEQSETRESMIEALAEIRFIEPDLCDAYMEHHAVSVAMWDAVHRSRGNPDIVSKADILEFNQFGLDFVLISDELRAWLVEVVLEAATHHSLRAFARHIVSELFTTLREYEASTNLRLDSK